MSYVVLTPDGTLAYTDDGLAMVDTLEEARDLRQWVATEFMGHDSATAWGIAEITIDPLPESELTA